MREEDQTNLKKFFAFLVASLLLHVGFFLFFYKLNATREGHLNIPKNQEVVFINPADILPPTALKSGRPKEMVDLAKPKVQVPPKNARYISQYDSSVKEETVARKIPKKARVDVDKSENSGRKGKAVKAKLSKKKKLYAAKPKDTKTTPAPPKEISPEIFESSEPKKVSLSDLQLRPMDFKELMEPLKKDKAESGKKGKSRGRELAALHPRPGALGSGDRFAHDFVPHVKIGDKTYLNANAHPDVQYFTRLKRIFRLRFNPRSPLVAHFRSNRVVVGQVNVTMAVEVSPSGQLSKLFVVRSSGIPGYDREALRTVRQSAPFSSPPKRIRSKDGMLRMTWHFTTYL